MNWRIGATIPHDILGQDRAAYGQQIVAPLPRQLTEGFGASFSRQNLFHMIRFVEAWPNETEAPELAQHMGWSHFKEILYLDNPLQPDSGNSIKKLRHAQTEVSAGLREVLC